MKIWRSWYTGERCVERVSVWEKEVERRTSSSYSFIYLFIFVFDYSNEYSRGLTSWKKRDSGNGMNFPFQFIAKLILFELITSFETRYVEYFMPIRNCLFINPFPYLIPKKKKAWKTRIRHSYEGKLSKRIN